MGITRITVCQFCCQYLFVIGIYILFDCVVSSSSLYVYVAVVHIHVSVSLYLVYVY